MKLTNYMRDAFIRAVMADVPAEDTKGFEAEVHKLVLDDALSKCPPQVRALWNDPKTQPWVSTNYIGFSDRTHGAYFSSLVVPSANRDNYSMSDKVVEKVKVIGVQKKAVVESRLELERKLRAVAHSVTTRKLLAEALPEFEKYLPADQEKAVRSLPVVANVVSDFVKAGWPKGGKKAPAAK